MALPFSLFPLASGGASSEAAGAALASRKSKMYSVWEEALLPVPELMSEEEVLMWPPSEEGLG